jgi:hypothetical protein
MPYFVTVLFPLGSGRRLILPMPWLTLASDFEGRIGRRYSGWLRKRSINGKELAARRRGEKIPTADLQAVSN